jgi:hypothetical protein
LREMLESEPKRVSLTCAHPGDRNRRLFRLKQQGRHTSPPFVSNCCRRCCRWP